MRQRRKGGLIVLGLTGSIAMGKSSVASMARKMGIEVHDADRAVRDILEHSQKAQKKIEARFPGVFLDGKIDRNKLSEIVFRDSAALGDLEAILHPLVRDQEKRFLLRARAARRKIVVLEIPLLFETGAEARCDAIMVVSAPFFIQKARAMARPKMSEEKFVRILERQLSDREKCRRADFVIPTGIGKRASFIALRRALSQIRKKEKRKEFCD